MLAYGIIYIYCSFTYVFRHLSDGKGLKFRYRNSFNNFRKDMRFGTDWVDFLLNTLLALYNIFHNGPIHRPLNYLGASLVIVMFLGGSK